jgi:exopolyphosphatase/guanosine-5'-triphosphate,3'-diphosphate pyrophosphatase
MPGFSKKDQLRLATLLVGHTGKLGKLANNAEFLDWRMLFALRLAQLLCRGRIDANLPKVSVSESGAGYAIEIAKVWLEKHPLTEFSLRKEAAEWDRIGRPYTIKLV